MHRTANPVTGVQFPYATPNMARWQSEYATSCNGVKTKVKVLHAPPYSRFIMQNVIVDYSNGLLGLGIDDMIQQELNKIQDSLNKIAELQRRKIAPVPGPTWVPNPSLPVPYMPMLDYPACGVCGMKFTGPMSYVCPRTDCPSGVSCG